MPEFVYELPAYTLTARFILLALVAMFIGMLVCKPILRLLIGAGDDFNSTLSQTSASFTLFYGLLLGLLTVSSYQNHERAQQNVFQEVNELANLMAAVSTYPDPLRVNVHRHLRDYTLFTIEDDWPAHARGDFLPLGGLLMSQVRKELVGYEPQTEGQRIVHAQTFEVFQGLQEARLQRIGGVLLGIPDILWSAVMMGAAINILLITLLRMRPLQQFVLGSLSAVFLGIILSVIVSLDAPLRGATAVKPEAFELLWEKNHLPGGSWSEI